jgi:hypothetical protein
MKLMKVTYKMQNMMIPEFQHSVEFRLIQVMKMKMQMIQFGSIVNLIQMEMMKVIHKMRSMMIQEFQYPMKFEYLMIMKNSESIDDQQNQ